MLEVARRLAEAAPQAGLLGDGGDAAASKWLAAASGDLATNDFGRYATAAAQLNDHLRLRSYIAGYRLTLADLAVADALKGSLIANLGAPSFQGCIHTC